MSKAFPKSAAEWRAAYQAEAEAHVRTKDTLRSLGEVTQELRGKLGALETLDTFDLATLKAQLVEQFARVDAFMESQTRGSVRSDTRNPGSG